MKYKTLNIPLKTHERLMRIKENTKEKEGVSLSLGTIISNAIKSKYPEECGIAFGSVDEIGGGKNG